MAKRRLLRVDRVPLVGGALAVDFVNTTGARDSSSPRERLLDYGDVLVWCQRTNLISRAQRTKLTKEAQQRPKVSARVFDTMLEFREVLYRVFRGVIEKQTASPSDVAELNRLVAEGNRRRKLAVDKDGAQWEWNVDRFELDQMLWPLLDSAVTVLTSDRVKSLKKCGECDWLFIDVSKNQRRRWCKADCRDRVKSRRYYRRHRQ